MVGSWRAPGWGVVVVIVFMASTIWFGGGAPQVDAARSAPLGPQPACHYNDSGVAGLGCVNGDVAGVTSGYFSAGGSFTINSSPSGLGPCLTYTTTGCYYSLSNPSIVRCVYVANHDPTDVRSCPSLSTQGSISGFSAQRQGICSGALGGTYVYGGDARFPATWWITRARQYSQCEFQVPSTYEINNLRGATFFLVGTSVRECIEPAGGAGCDEASATLATRTEFGWLPVRGTLAPPQPIAGCEVIEQSGEHGEVITFRDTSELSEPGSSSLTTQFTFPDGSFSTATTVTKTAEEGGLYRATITATSGSGLTDKATCSARVASDKELEVELVIDPDQVKLDLDAGGAPEPQTVQATLTVKNVSDVSVPNVSIDADLATTLERGDTKAIAQTGPPTPPTTAIGTLADGATHTAVYEFEVSDAGIFGVEALVLWADPDTSQTERAFTEDFVEVEVNDGFEIALRGELTASPVLVKVIADISNNSENDIATIDWEAGNIQEEVVAGTQPLSIANGPLPDGLPGALDANSSVEVYWTMSAAEVGTMVYTLAASGTSSSGEVEAFNELTATVSAGLIESIDIQRQALAGFEDFLSQAYSTGEEFVQQTSDAALTETEQFRRAQYESWRGLGFGDSTARFLAAGDVQQQAVSNYFLGLIDGAVTEVDRQGAADGASLYKAWDTMTDADKRSAFANMMLNKAVAEYGYLSDGIADPNNPGFLPNIATGWSAAADETVDSIGFAAIGQAELWRIDAGEFAADPLKFSTKVGKRQGGQMGGAGYLTLKGVAEEVLTGGLGPVTRTANLVEEGVDGLRTVSRAEEVGETGSDAFGAPLREMAESEKKVKRYQDLDYGTTVTDDMLETLGGFSAADKAKVDDIVARVKAEHGIDIEIVFRTAEPNSVGIDGIGKRSFTSEKAVGELDVLIGAPPSLRGKVTIFKPTPLPNNVLEAMEAAEPGFTARYQKRLDTQQANWDKLQNSDSLTKTEKIVAASRKYEDSYGGVTVLSDAPGQPTYGIDFVEQLDEPGFIDQYIADPNVQARYPGLTTSDLEGLRTHPTRTKTNLELQEVDGAFTLVEKQMVNDGSTWTKAGEKPIISDYDGQAVRPVGGAPWPAGKRGQIETLVKVELDKIGRSGRHGWSDSAHDLPSDFYDKAAEYVMGTTHPAAAEATARQLAGRFERLSNELSGRADRLTVQLASVTDPAQKVALTKEVDRLRGLAQKYDKLKNPEDVLKKFKDDIGEKTIVFGQGRVTVGSNAGSTP